MQDEVGPDAHDGVEGDARLELVSAAELVGHVQLPVHGERVELVELERRRIVVVRVVDADLCLILRVRLVLDGDAVYPHAIAACALELLVELFLVHVGRKAHVEEEVELDVLALADEVGDERVAEGSQRGEVGHAARDEDRRGHHHGRANCLQRLHAHKAVSFIMNTCTHT